MSTDNWPDWANYRTTDANGAVYFWAEKPEAWGVTWNRTDARHEQDVNACPNWRDTLEERATS